MFRGLRRVRKMTYVLWAWVALIIAWIATSSANIHNETAKCVNQGVLDHTTCANAVGAGSGVAIFAILVLGFMGFVILSLTWFMTRPKTKTQAA